jgi:hypothetical protein
MHRIPNEFSDSLGLDLYRALGHRQNPQSWPGAGRRGQRRKCLTAKGDGIIARDNPHRPDVSAAKDFGLRKVRASVGDEGRGPSDKAFEARRIMKYAARPSRAAGNDKPSPLAGTSDFGQDLWTLNEQVDLINARG